MLNAMTIDVEDYFMVSAFADVVRIEDWHKFENRVERNTQCTMDILEEHDVKATFFILGWVAERSPRLVKEIQRRGHEVASHGYTHRLVYNLTPEEFREDTSRSRMLLEDLTGEAVLGYRAASYSITKRSLWALDILIEEGFVYDSSIFPIYHDRYGYPEFNRFAVRVSRDGAGEIMEIPLTTLRVFGKNLPIAGGGYLRLLPIQLIEHGIRTINDKEAQPAIVYFHPWELDTDQPRLSAGRLSTFRHYTNLKNTSERVHRLLRAFRFGTMKATFGL